MKQWQFTAPYFEYYESFKDNSTPWAGHKCFGYNIVRNLEPALVVELGSWKGTSFFSFCQAVKDTNLKTRLVAIDTWQGDSQAGHFGDEVLNHFQQVLSRYYHGINAGFLRQTFDSAASQFEDKSIDLLHIDGFHTYEAVSNDFNTWIGKVKDTGVVLFHDVNERKDDFGVYRFWDEIKSTYKYCFDFTHSHGLGILVLGEEVYNVMAPEFEKTKIQCLDFSYQDTKAELYLSTVKLRELDDIKKSKFWKLKEGMKKLAGR